MSVELNTDNTINHKDGDSNVLEQETPVQIVTTWDEFELNPDLLRGIYAHGFEKPSPIQSKAIKPILDGNDLIDDFKLIINKVQALILEGHNFNDIVRDDLRLKIAISETLKIMAVNNYFLGDPLLWDKTYIKSPKLRG